MSWHEWLLIEQNQFVVVLGMLFSVVSYVVGEKIGYREGYEDGVRTMAKIALLNDLDIDAARKSKKNGC